ncbi:MAG: NDP-hexose 2,3-dehydratase family protein [Nitrospirae bacterium]|nr:NDP-hexose 2,3-dehydratase family protein [Nitrospirota bacterium]
MPRALTSLNAKEVKFLRSALTEENAFMTTRDCLQWLEHRRKQTHVQIEQIPFAKLRKWYFDKDTGNLRHESGRFFSIEGAHVKTNYGFVSEWSQPIINQPEIGILGIITREINGILYFLMQAKIEPGNINYVQLSPTLQATKSNYTKIHKGASPEYLEYFTDSSKSRVLSDQLQSEQGARFLKKRNRNIIVEIDDNILLKDNFCWLTLGQIIRLMEYDNVVNMDTRTVISGIQFGSLCPEQIELYIKSDFHRKEHTMFQPDILTSMFDNTSARNTIDDIISWITGLKTRYELNVENVPLNSVREWQKDDYAIHHKTKNFFSVIAVLVEIENREVASWTQPLIRAAQEGIISFLMKKFSGVSHFLVQAKLEAGNFDILEMAPTVQCITGNYRNAPSDKRPPFLDYVLNAREDQIKYSTYQSEEGGRFYREQNRNLIIEVDDSFPAAVPDNYIWMTLNQLKQFIKYNNYLNIQARTLLSAIGLK